MKKLVIILIVLGLVASGVAVLKLKFQKTSTSATQEKPFVLETICEGNLTNNFDCFEQHYQKLVQVGGTKLAFADLRARYQKDDFIKSQCHPLTHVIGNEAAGYYANVSEAFASGDSFCWSGYYHGTMEGVVGKIGRKNIASSMDGICAQVPGKEKYSFDYYNCVHGLGHGIMAIHNDELFDSLKICDSLSGAWERQSCWSGVFMENVIVDNNNHFTKYLKKTDPLYPCNVVEDQYKNTCYMMQTSYILKIVNSDFTKVFDWCRKVGVAYVNTCFQSLGRDASGNSVSDQEKTKAICLLGRDFTEQSNCIIGAVKDFISYYHSDKEARGLCAILPESFYPSCNSTIITYYASFK